MSPRKPLPVTPREPLPEECCGQGCTPCVFDRYAEALNKYNAELAARKLRRRGRKNHAGRRSVRVKLP